MLGLADVEYFPVEHGHTQSPISRLGIMEPEGMRNGSTRKERNRNTSRITGKNARAYSTNSDSL